MNHIKVQFGVSYDADFQKRTWKFEMPKQYEVRAGQFAIVPKETFDAMLKALIDLVEVNGMELTDDNCKVISEKHNAAKEAIKKATA